MPVSTPGPTRATASGVNAGVQVQPSTSSTGIQNAHITSNAGVQFNSAFQADLDRAVVDMSSPPVRPDVIAMAMPDDEEIASAWGSSYAPSSSASSSAASSRTPSKASSSFEILDNWRDDLNAEQQERHDTVSNRYNKLPEDELRKIYKYITKHRPPSRMTKEELIEHLLYENYLKTYRIILSI